MSRRPRAKSAQGAADAAQPTEAAPVSGEYQQGNDPLAGFTGTQREIIRLKYQHRRLSNAQIAKLLGLSRQAVHQHFKSAELDRIMVELDKDAYARVSDLQGISLDVTRELLMNPNSDPWLRWAICREFNLPLVQNKAALPRPPGISEVHFTDSSRPQLPPEKA